MLEYLLNLLKNAPETLKSKITNLTLRDAFSFVFGILKNWYIYMTIASVYIAYYFFKALEESGILDKFTTLVEKQMATIFYIAKVCFPKMGVLKDMLECIKCAPFCG